MHTEDADDGRRLDSGGLRIDAYVVVASGAMSAGDADRARRDGRLAMKTPDGGTARLEAGGVVVAEGRVRRRGGKSAFIVTRVYGDGGEATS